MNDHDEIHAKLDEILILLRAQFYPIFPGKDPDTLTLEVVDAGAKLPAKRNKKPDTTPYDAVLSAWEEICQHLPQPQNPSDELKAKLKAFWHNAEKYSKWVDIDPHAWMHGLFSLVAASDFLSGRSPTSNKCGWKASIRWVMQPAHFNQIIDGNYDNAKRTG